MIKANVLQAAEWVEENEKFLMSKWCDPFANQEASVCNTAGCIGGTIAFRLGVLGPVIQKSRNKMAYNSSQLADCCIETGMKFLGIDRDTADELFIPSWIIMSSITSKIAAATLRYFAETGIVDYERHGANVIRV